MSGLAEGLNDPDAARRVRDEAMGRVQRAASIEWEARAEKVIVQLAMSQPELSADDIWPLIPKTRENRALGPVMTKLQKARVIAPTDRIKSSARASRHAGNVRVWRSLIYGGVL